MEFTGTKKTVAGIRGSSTINHRIRVALGLNMTEYAVAIYLEENLHRKPAEVLATDKTWKDLGLRNIRPVFNALSIRNIIKQDENIIDGYQFTDFWKVQFEMKTYFDQLWKIFLQKGNKHESIKRFATAIRKVNIEILLKQAELYMKPKSKETADRHFIMALEVWLNKKQWENVYEAPEGKKEVLYKRPKS